MWCLQCTSDRTQSFVELDSDSWTAFKETVDDSVEGDAPVSELGASADPSGSYVCKPVIHRGGLGLDHLDSQLYGHIFLPNHLRPRRPKLQHSQSILRKQAEEEAIKRSRSLSESYELSSDLQDKQVEMLERKYGGRFITRHAARTIQTAFRQYQMNKNFERLRSSMSENRMSRRIVLSNMRMQLSFEGPEKVHSSYFEGKQVSLSDEGTKIGALVQSEHSGERGVQIKTPSTQSDFTDAITELEDAFSRQVKSLAESIDDALNCRSLHGEDSPLEQGRGHPDMDRELSCQVKSSHSAAEHRKLDEMTASYSDVTLYIDEEELSPPLTMSQSGDRPPSTELDLRQRSLNSSQDYWLLAHKDEKGDTDTSCRSTPSLECQEQGLRVDHLPLLTIEPPSDSSVELSDRSDRSSLKRQNAYERSLSNQHSSPKHISHSLPPRGPSREEEAPRHRPRQLEAHLAINGTANRQSKSESDFSDGDNDSINSTSNSNDTINCSSESSSRDSLREQTLSKQTYHKETRNSWDSPAFSNDIIRKRHYRIGLNLFNKKPEKGIQYLMERNFVPDTPVGVAHFLLQRKGLSRQMIGEFLGNRQKQFNRDVLESDLHVCVGLIQEPRKLKDSVLMIYGRYAPNADTVERSSADGSQPLCHQHDHLEKTINSLQMKLVKSAKEHERIYVKIMKVLQEDVHLMDLSLTVGRVLHPVLHLHRTLICFCLKTEVTQVCEKSLHSTTSGSACRPISSLLTMDFLMFLTVSLIFSIWLFSSSGDSTI
ncbi:IQ motif and S7 domain-containing protein 1 [Goodea atripinnis]|uniref:IQ motif and S7 domain-containing protein 1 n=1 Tax=Goodea atripinnis TaxID=208336 RepID=A0ABV0PBK6_9TELE